MRRQGRAVNLGSRSHRNLEGKLSQGLSSGAIEPDLHFPKGLSSIEQKESSLEAKEKVRTRIRCATCFSGRYKEKCGFYTLQIGGNLPTSPKRIELLSSRMVT